MCMFATGVFLYKNKYHDDNTRAAGPKHNTCNWPAVSISVKGL